MEVYINKVTGIEDAMVSLLMSKRSWTPEKNAEIRQMCAENLDATGAVIDTPSEEFCTWMDKLIRYGASPEYGHTTLLRFIDVSITVVGLHRAGQDDWDAHVRRMDNRIVRASTRLGNNTAAGLSNFYKDKIKLPFDIMEALAMPIPPEVYIDGKKYVKDAYGYVEAQYAENIDVIRGLYPEAMESMFICKIQYPELCHILQMRDSISNRANAEVQKLANSIEVGLYHFNKWLADNVWTVCMDPAGTSAMVRNKELSAAVKRQQEEIIKLRKAKEELDALEAHGVESWEGYDKAIEAFREGEE